MKNQILSLLAFCFLFFSCSEKSESNSVSNEWELVIEDSIQVDFMGEIWMGTYENGKGIIKDITSQAVLQFDSTGKLLVNKVFPKDGPGKVDWFEGIVIDENGEIFASTLFNNIYHFDPDLNLVETLKMPFAGEARGGMRNARNLSKWNNKLLLWYPGRDGISPYIDNFYREYPLLELFDISTQTSIPLINTPPTSKFSTNEYFNRPYIQFTIESDSLYLTFSNEELVHIYTLPDGKWIRSINFQPTDFKLYPGQKAPVTYQQMITMSEAKITGIYSDPKHLILSYQGGIDSETFIQNELKESKNFYKYPEFNNSYLKVFSIYQGKWSNEIEIPAKIDFILNIESTDQPFYALRNDDFIGEEQEYLTFYKLKLRQK
ncbi:NHL repeat-containing protein [Algoriphagus boritolerans]|uniref:6-bladed beta-propeller protein n=1 Tax=Algoriphagus boritolerans DSM 17298 = JCM 18970 TaxID=1120964 RepID=A0A1H5UVI6_9BACT|nr:hypothetical protein [Algoriphagus boritolerans]SEF78227.1 hypothetical protein SAMN03080598_01376 [Algoriphagus boritolerans DSM 17298 = JCM 18970]